MCVCVFRFGGAYFSYKPADLLCYVFVRAFFMLLVFLSFYIRFIMRHEFCVLFTTAVAVVRRLQCDNNKHVAQRIAPAICLSDFST